VPTIDEPTGLQGFSWANRRYTFCLPCRRSRVRIPSAASKKACICRPFLRTPSACASASGRTDLRTRPGPIARRSKENPLFAGPFWFVRTQVLLRARRRLSVLPTGAVSRILLHGRFLRTDGMPTGYQRYGPPRPVRFHSGNRGVHSVGGRATGLRSLFPPRIVREVGSTRGLGLSRSRAARPPGRCSRPSGSPMSFSCAASTGRTGRCRWGTAASTNRQVARRR
jgi:hypothetical protein